MGWLTGWLYRKSHIINAATGAGANYQKQITVNYGAGADNDDDVYCTIGGVAHCKTDFGDIRFTDDDGNTELDYWMESKTDSNNAVFWVEVKDSLESNNQTIYVYYGKADATTTSSAVNTLVYFHNFEGETVDQPPTKFLSTTSMTIQADTAEGTRCLRYAVSGNGTFNQMDMADIAGLCINYKWKNLTPFQSCITIRHTSDSDTIYIGGVYGNPANYFGINSESGSNYTAFTYGTGWHDVQVTAYGGAISATIDTTTVNHTTTQLDAKKCSVRDWNSVTAYFDYIRIRKYCSPEPAHSTWGTEEGNIKKGSSLAATVTQMLNNKILFNFCNRFPKFTPRRF